MKIEKFPNIELHHIGNGTFRIKIRVEVNRKPVAKQETVVCSRARALNRAFELLNSIRNGIPSEISRTKIETLGDALDLYKKFKKNGNIPYKDRSRFNTIKSDLGMVSIPALANVFEEYLHDKKNTANKSTRRPLTEGSINKIKVLVKCALEMAVDRNLIDTNPLKGEHFNQVKVPARKNSLTPDQEANLLTVITDPKNSELNYLGPVVKFCLQVPCRKAEILGMRSGDLNLKSDPPHIYVPGYREIDGQISRTKNMEDCWKPIPTNMMDYFTRLPPETDFLFYRLEAGKYRPLGDFKKAWAKAKNLAGIGDFHFHDTRCCAVSKIVKKGSPVSALGKTANWKNPLFMVYSYLDLVPLEDLKLLKVD